MNDSSVDCGIQWLLLEAVEGGCGRMGVAAGEGRGVRYSHPRYIERNIVSSAMLGGEWLFSLQEVHRHALPCVRVRVCWRYYSPVWCTSLGTQIFITNCVYILMPCSSPCRSASALEVRAIINIVLSALLYFRLGSNSRKELLDLPESEQSTATRS